MLPILFGLALDVRITPIMARKKDRGKDQKGSESDSSIKDWGPCRTPSEHDSDSDSQPMDDIVDPGSPLGENQQTALQDLLPSASFSTVIPSQLVTRNRQEQASRNGAYVRNVTHQSYQLPQQLVARATAAMGLDALPDGYRIQFNQTVATSTRIVPTTSAAPYNPQRVPAAPAAHAW